MRTTAACKRRVCRSTKGMVRTHLVTAWTFQFQYHGRRRRMTTLFGLARRGRSCGSSRGRSLPRWRWRKRGLIAQRRTCLKIVVSLVRTGRWWWFATMRRRWRGRRRCQIRSIVENIIHRSFRLVQRALAVMETFIRVEGGGSVARRRGSVVVCRHGFSRNHNVVRVRVRSRAREREQVYLSRRCYRVCTQQRSLSMLSAWATRDAVGSIDM
jgi:hypothetical protein